MFPSASTTLEIFGSEKNLALFFNSSIPQKVNAKESPTPIIIFLLLNLISFLRESKLPISKKVSNSSTYIWFPP